jgi:FixJ family two-component response regulator
MENSAAGPMQTLTAIAVHFGNVSACPGTRPDGSSMLPKTWDETSMTDRGSLVSVVDDDESMRESLPDLLKELGFAASAFSSAEEFLESPTLSMTGCLLLDIAMPGMGGLELQLELKRRGIDIPIVFITAHRDEAERRRVLEQGAVDCLIKPFSDTALLSALRAAFRMN